MSVFIAIVAFMISLAWMVLLTGAEYAVGAVSRDLIEKLIEGRVRGALLLYLITRNRRQYQIMLMSGRIVATVLGVFALYAAFTGAALETPGWIALSIAAAVSAILFILAEGILARALAFGEYEDTVARFAPVLAVSHYLLYPLTWGIDRITSLVIKKNSEMAAKEEALIEFVKSESEAGVIELEESGMIQGVLDFFDSTVREVMIPRIDVIAVEKDTPMPDLIALFKEKGHSRIPVFDERIDNILGVIYAKDILPVVAMKGAEGLSITETMRKPLYVPEKKKTSELLREFKKEKVHIAIVVDEYGGTAGIVALEDLLEEIVGDIQDEYDRDERDYLWINDRTVVVDAGLDIDDVNEIIHADLPREDFDTLGGFIYDQFGSIPKSGDSFVWKDITFTIRDVNGNRISKVVVKLSEPLMKRENDDDE